MVSFSMNITENSECGRIFVEEYEGVPVVRISAGGDAFNADTINFFNNAINDAFLELCSIVHPDVIHCHNIIGMSLGIIDIAKEIGIKTVVRLHDNWGICFKNTLLDNQERLCRDFTSCERCMSTLNGGGISIPIGVRKKYLRRIFENVDAYISPSQYLADTYLRAGFDVHKMNVIWNGIDVDRFSKIKRIESSKTRISVIANFGRHKGIEVLIKAISVLKREDIEINLIGSGEEENNYKTLASECGVLHQLRFWGKIPSQDIEKVFAETDIYCLPSIWPENQPVSITEAMASGIPVVASNLGGSKELVMDGKTGLLFEAGNEVDLAEKLECLIDNEEKRKEYGEAGRKIISQHSLHKQVYAINCLYEKVVIQ